MQALLADAINFPMVFVAGIIVLVPLMAFEVFVEAFVLKTLWRLRYGDLCTLAWFANVWSLLAGIPTKILNALMYERVLPQDIPGFFVDYPYAASAGSFIYFAVSTIVEGAYALRWNRRNALGLSSRRIWMGMLLANVSTYAVLAPLYYYWTQPRTEIQEFRIDTKWTGNKNETVLFVDRSDNHLKSIHLDGSAPMTVIPFAIRDYLVSSNLQICLFRGIDANLYFYQTGASNPELVWKTEERFLMKQVAFSPSGKFVAYASDTQKTVELIDRSSGERKRLPLELTFDFDEPSVAWSPDESMFYIGGLKSNLVLAINLRSDGGVIPSRVEGTNPPSVLSCFGRIGSGGWWSGSDWGASYSHDECADLKASVWPGLDSGLSISRQHGEKASRVLGISVRPGLLHLARFSFGDVAFIEGCQECLFEANGYTYLLNIEQKRIGILTHGGRFVLLTPRYQKAL